MEQKRPAARVQQGFLHGAFILMFGVLLVKAIGALFKIPLSSIITEDGMGYFSTAYSFFNVLFSLSTVGFPVAVARLTAAEDALGHAANQSGGAAGVFGHRRSLCSADGKFCTALYALGAKPRRTFLHVGACAVCRAM